MGKLHELIAVEAQLQGTAKKIVEEAVVTFSKKADHFLAVDRRYEPFRDGPEHQLPSEMKAMVTTVPDKLAYTFGPVVKWLDAVLQKEVTNGVAKADLVLEDGTVLAKDVPAPFLLGLETKLKEMRTLFEHIPTLAPGYHWTPDPNAGPGVYTRPNEERMRTQKVTKPVVLYEATKEHPAQVREVAEDVTIGKYVETHWSGMITPARKSELLARVDALIVATKQARQRANSAEVVKATIGKALTDYLLG